MSHFYFVAKFGNQKIWVLSPPRAYVQWPHEVLKGMSEADAKAKLQKNNETFTADNRRLMAESTTFARKWSQNAVAKLGSPDAKTLEVVKKWFHGDIAATEALVKATASTLLAGFQEDLPSLQ